LAGDKSAQAASIRKMPPCLASSQILGSGRLYPLRMAHLPPLQQNMSRAGGALLGLGQWESEKEGTSLGGARRIKGVALADGIDAGLHPVDDLQGALVIGRYYSGWNSIKNRAEIFVGLWDATLFQQ
jgi:hypothetical protein